MSLVPAICTQCGAKIEVENTHEAGICKHCGTPFITEKVINNFNTNVTNNNNFSGANVNIVGENVEQVIKNIENLMVIGKLHDAEKELKQLSIKHSTNREIWVVYARLSYKKYVEEGNEDNYKEKHTYADDLINPRLDISARCQRCLDELKQYKKYYGDEVSIEIETLIEKVSAIKAESDKEILDYLYHIPKCFCFDINWESDGAGTKFRWTDKKGNTYWVREQTIGIIQDFIYDCENNMKTYIEEMNTNNKLNDYKLVSYLCGEQLAKSLSNAKSNAKSWSVVGFNGYTLIINYNYSDIWDNEREVYATNILIQNNVKEILLEACKMELQEQNACYIATCVYGSYDCPEVWTLRRFRDYVLDKTWYGRIFIKCYYNISPTMVKWFGNKKWFRTFWRHRLDAMVSRLNISGINNTQYQDRY